MYAALAQSPLSSRARWQQPADSASSRQPAPAPSAQNAWATLKPAHAPQFAHSPPSPVRRSAYAFFGPSPVKSHLFLNYVNPLGELVTELIPQLPPNMTHGSALGGSGDICLMSKARTGRSPRCSLCGWSPRQCVHGFDAWER